MIQPMDNRYQFVIIILFGILGFINLSYALPEDRQAMFYLKSDTADIDQSTHVGIFTGHVEIDQGTTHLRSNTAKTIGNANNQLTQAIAKGSPSKQAHFWSQMSDNKPLLHAWADAIYYFPEQNRVELVGNAKVQQGDDTFKAPKIIYDTKNQHVITKAEGTQRTTITLNRETA